MKNDTLWIVAALVAAYYYIHWDKLKAKAQISYAQPGARGGLSTLQSGASTTPRNRQQVPYSTNVNSGNGSGFAIAPVANVGSLNRNPSRVRSAGTPSPGGQGSSAWSGIATAFVAPQFPTRVVSSTGTTTIAPGTVQVPSYTAVPLTARGPGGGGALLQQGA